MLEMLVIDVILLIGAIGVAVGLFMLKAAYVQPSTWMKSLGYLSGWLATFTGVLVIIFSAFLIVKPKALAVHINSVMERCGAIESGEHPQADTAVKKGCRIEDVT